MPQSTDLFGSLLSMDHNPLDQLIDDPSDLFKQLTQGIGDPITAIPGNTESSISEALTGNNAGLTAIEDWVETIPILGPLVEAILGETPTSGSSGYDSISTYFSGLEQMLGMPDFNSGTYNPTAAVDNFISEMLGPSGQLAMLTEGLINDLNIPGLDASKIVSGLFPQSMVDALETDLDTMTTNIDTAFSDLQSLGTLINEQLGGTASTVNIFTANGSTVIELSAANIQTPVAFTGLTAPSAVCLDNNDNLYVADSTNAAVYARTSAGVQTTLPFTGLFAPTGLTVDGSGNVYVADTNAGKVFKLTPAGVQTTVGFTGLAQPCAVAVDILGAVYVADQSNAAVYKLSGSTQTTIGFTGLAKPSGLLVDLLGDVYVSDRTNAAVYKLSLGGSTQTTLAFTGLTGPGHLAIDDSGSIYVADHNSGGTSGFIYKLNTGGTQTTVGLSGLSKPLGVAVQNADWALIQAALQQIQAQQSSQLNSLLSDLGLSSTGSLAQYLQGFGDDISETWSTLTGQVDADITDVENWVGNLLTPTSPISTTNLFGQIDADLMALVPVSHIGQPATATNLVSDPNFTQATSVGGSVFTQDATQTHNGIAGSAKVVADGTGPKSLLSNLIPVSPGQTLDVSAAAQWSGLASTNGSDPFVLGLNYYSDKLGVNLLSQTVIQALPASPATTTWQNMAGTSVVPASAMAVRLRFDLLSSATAGTGWFTAANISKAGLLPATLSGYSGGGTVDATLGSHAGLLATIQTDISTLLPQSDFTSLIAALGGGSEVTDVVDWVDTLLTGQSTINGANLQAGSVPTAAVPDFGTLFNNIVNQVLGLAGTGNNQASVSNAFSHQADVITGQSSTIASLQAQITALQATQAGSAIVTDTDQFLRFNSANLGGNWAQQFAVANAGSYGTAFGIAASWNASGVAANSVINQWVGTNQNSASDTQEITIVLSSQGVNGSTPSAVDVLGRMSADRKNFIRLRFGADGSVYVSRTINGVETIILAEPPGYIFIPPGLGARLTLVTGIPGLPRTFQGFLNGNQVISTPDTVSLYGTAYRGWGFGAAAGVVELLGTPIAQATPATVSQWTAIG